MLPIMSGKHDVCANGEVEHSHNHDEVETNCTNCSNQAGLKVTQHVGR